MENLFYTKKSDRNCWREKLRQKELIWKGFGKIKEIATDNWDWHAIVDVSSPIQGDRKASQCFNYSGDLMIEMEESIFFSVLGIYIWFDSFMLINHAYRDVYWYDNFAFINGYLIINIVFYSLLIFPIKF